MKNKYYLTMKPGPFKEPTVKITRAFSSLSVREYIKKMQK